MSTYWYFECQDHNPPLRSESEFTQHSDDSHYVNAIQLLNSRPVEWTSPSGDYFERNARDFLHAHPHCQIDAVSEYGDRRPLTTQGTRSRDADHAVALEREAVAAWLEDMADGHDRELTWLAARGRTAEADAQEAESDRLRGLAQQIRNGEHHASTPPNAQERGQE